MQEKLEQKNEALQHFKIKSNKLEKSLENTKIFLNMVIHDLRNPTNQVEYLVNQSVKKLKIIQTKYHTLKNKLSEIPPEIIDENGDVIESKNPQNIIKK